MWDSLPNFSQDITEHYFSIWNNELSWLQTNLRLEDVFCVPDATTFLDRVGIGYVIQYSIHHMTLSSILKELVTEGKLSTEDFEKYSIYAQPQIKVEMK